MSGGSYDYCYTRVLDMAGSIRHKDKNPLRRAFAAHLRLVADAMHDIEWVDSGDYGEGDEEEGIRKVLASGAELAAAIQMAEDARRALDAALAVASRKDAGE
jgi:hypothetical protein